MTLAFCLAASMLGMIGVLVTVNSVIFKDHAEFLPNLVGLLFFTIAASAVVTGQTIGQRISAAIVEGLLDRIRVELVELVRRADYGRLETIGGHTVYDSLTRNSSTMTEAAPLAIHGAASLGALVMGGFYTLTLSPLVFTVISVLVVVSTFFYRLSQRQTRGALAWVSAAQTRFYDLLRHLLDGFKEVKLNEPRGDDLEHNYLVPESDNLRDAQIAATVQINRGIAISYSFFYLMLAILAFVLPAFISDQKVIGVSVYVAIFMLGLVEVILKSVPTVIRASFAIDELDGMRATLADALRDELPDGGSADFKKISGVDLLYSYYDHDGALSFTMGPTSMELSKGEMLFIVGGNGSGKSTLLKAFTRLYQPQGGSLLWDGTPVVPANARAYRSLFSSVFSDFHLFDRLYGMDHVPEERVNALLEDLGIAHKTRYQDGRFTNTDLSTGQRKRLALAVALLEERPILVLDELAADQDPEFRQRFYGELVPRWKAEGRSLIIVSHDDRYFHIADRTMILADGRAKAVPPAGAAEAGPGTAGTDGETGA